ncbi:MAG: alpha/beta hydrolase [Lachnospiraceae bacterium]|nr:alpha/beta hydrolase [Lachnospiraceae bacterium]
MEKIYIWGDEIPGNSSRLKAGDMDIRKGARPLTSMLRMLGAIRSNEVLPKHKQAYDSYTYAGGISRGREKATYEDEPYLVPFLSEGARKAVIIVPGGAYAYKQTDADAEGKQAEGDLAARVLNEEGVSAFVLWYRTNPYRMPVPLLDLQRAIRFVRFHAHEYGIDPGHIGLLGFSAGGFEVLGHINLIHGKNLFPDQYHPDEVDEVSDHVSAAACGYPMVGFRSGSSMLYNCFPAEEVNDPEKREQLLSDWDCAAHITSGDVPQFITYGTKDQLIDPVYTEEYIRRLKEAGGEVVLVRIDGAGHGYGAATGKMKKCGLWITEYRKWLKLSL